MPFLVKKSDSKYTEDDCIVAMCRSKNKNPNHVFLMIEKPINAELKEMTRLDLKCAPDSKNKFLIEVDRRIPKSYITVEEICKDLLFDSGVVVGKPFFVKKEVLEAWQKNLDKSHVTDQLFIDQFTITLSPEMMKEIFPEDIKQFGNYSFFWAKKVLSDLGVDLKKIPQKLSDFKDTIPDSFSTETFEVSPEDLLELYTECLGDVPDDLPTDKIKDYMGWSSKVVKKHSEEIKKRQNFEKRRQIIEDALFHPYWLSRDYSADDKFMKLLDGYEKRQEKRLSIFRDKMIGSIQMAGAVLLGIAGVFFIPLTHMLKKENIILNKAAFELEEGSRLFQYGPRDFPYHLSSTEKRDLRDSYYACLLMRTAFMTSCLEIPPQNELAIKKLKDCAHSFENRKISFHEKFMGSLKVLSGGLMIGIGVISNPFLFKKDNPIRKKGNFLLNEGVNLIRYGSSVITPGFTSTLLEVADYLNENKPSAIKTKKTDSSRNNGERKEKPDAKPEETSTETTGLIVSSNAAIVSEAVDNHQSLLPMNETAVEGFNNAYKNSQLVQHSVFNNNRCDKSKVQAENNSLTKSTNLHSYKHSY